MNADTKQACSKLEKQCENNDYTLITKNYALYKGNG